MGIVLPSNKKILILTGILLIFALILLTSSVSFAAGDNASTAESMANIGTNDSFQDSLTTLAKGMIRIARTISVIFIALGGIMVAFNVESANKLLWNAMLGIGLALNTFLVINGLFGNLYLGSGASAPVLDFTFDLADGDSEWYKFPTKFTQQYENYCKAGAAAIMPIAAKLLLVLTAINASIKVSLGLISGDKIKFLVETCLTTGFYLFLILNWFNGDGSVNGVAQSNGMNLMGSLMEGFRDIGQKAGGLKEGDTVQGDVIGMGCKMFLAGIGASDKGVSWLERVTSPVMTLGSFIALAAMVIILFLTGLEIIMARIEFVTLAMISVIMIPWGALKQTNFLFTSTISAMFNQAIKVSVISFIEIMSCTVLTGYCDKFAEQAKSGKFFGDWTLILQVVMISIMLYFITKKVPELVTSLISGTPQLGAASMVATAKNVSHAAVQGGAAAATGAVGVAKGAASGAFKAAGTNTANKAHGVGAALNIAGGALSGAAGAMMSGFGGMAKQGLLGRKNNGTGGGGAAGGGGTDGRRGGLFGGAISSYQKGKDLAQGFNSGKTLGDYGRQISGGKSWGETKDAFRGKLAEASDAIKHPQDSIKNTINSAKQTAVTAKQTAVNSIKHTDSYKTGFRQTHQENKRQDNKNN